METVLTATKIKWIADPTHSEITFKLKHLMITNVKGTFRKFEAEIDGEDFTNATINASIDAASIFTNDDNRETHLKSAEFFDTDNFPTLNFEGTSFKKLDDDNYKLTGNLIMKGISKEVVFDVEFGGIIKDSWGNEKAGFSLS